MEPSIGLAQLYASVRHHGFAAEIMDVSNGLCLRQKNVSHGLWTEEMSGVWKDERLAQEFLEKERGFIETEYLGKIVSFPNPVVGFSVSWCSLSASFVLARWIKACRPDTRVVFGGQFFTVIPHSPGELLRDHPEVDAVVVGDGEDTFVDVLSRLQGGRSLDGCAGLFVRDGEGRPAFTGDRPAVDLDKLPFADYSVFDLSRYGTDRLRSYDLAFMASRGCVRQCSFCGNRAGWTGFRQMSGDRVYREIVHQRKAMPNLEARSRIKFYDILMNGSMRKLNRLCDLLISDAGPRLEWHECNAVVRSEMTDEFCRKLRKAGCRTLIIGFESGSQNILNLMDKRQTVEEMKTVLRNIDRAGLEVRANFMVGHPGETEADFEKTLDFLREMRPYIHLLYPSYTFTHLQGRLEQNPEQWGVIPHENALYWESADGKNTYPVRLDRYKTLIEVARGLGIKVIDGLQMSMEAYTNFCLAGYWEAKGKKAEALRYYERYSVIDPGNQYVLGKLTDLRPQ